MRRPCIETTARKEEEGNPLYQLLLPPTTTYQHKLYSEEPKNHFTSAIQVEAAPKFKYHGLQCYNPNQLPAKTFLCRSLVVCKKKKPKPTVWMEPHILRGSLY